MKKVLVFMALVAAVSFSSCGNKSAEATTETVAETETVIEEATPAAPEVEVADSTVVEAAEDTTAVPAE